MTQGNSIISSVRWWVFACFCIRQRNSFLYPQHVKTGENFQRHQIISLHQNKLYIWWSYSMYNLSQQSPGVPFECPCLLKDCDFLISWEILTWKWNMAILEPVRVGNAVLMI